MVNPPTPRELSGDQLSAIKDDLFHGKKIAAIKKHREATGSNLKDAKMFVDQLESELRAASPELFVVQPASAGCGAFIISIFVIAAVVMVVLWLLKK
ncbi:MAG: ribosomal protein L7/L12 [Planctomycetes bacterium]|nr:ribosomal protein L7/L12 [Planctomycetota bacterium]